MAHITHCWQYGCKTRKRVRGSTLSGIFQAINLLGAFGSAIEAGKPIKLRPGYYTPGFMAVLCAFLRRRNVPAEGLLYDCPKVSGYFRAMRISQVLWGVDDYQYGRPNAGTNYAPLTHLASREAVDDATQQINGCLREMAGSARLDYRDSVAFKELMHVVGELHDNVWSHGLDCGFSLAQRRKHGGQRSEIEFALADNGMGFLGELRSSGVAKRFGIQTDQEAIDWCVKEGNSSKLVDTDDGWGQSLSEDFVGANPYGAGVTSRAVAGGNHHQGLGLAKLLALAKAYDGILHLQSGDTCLSVKHGVLSFNRMNHSWQGVAISLTLDEAKMAAAKQPETTADVDEIMKLLRG